MHSENYAEDTSSDQKRSEFEEERKRVLEFLKQHLPEKFYNAVEKLLFKERKL